MASTSKLEAIVDKSTTRVGGKLAEATQEGERVVKETQKWKVVDKTQGGEKNKKLLWEKQKTIGAKNKKNKMRKGGITYVDKSTTRV